MLYELILHRRGKHLFSNFFVSECHILSNIWTVSKLSLCLKSSSTNSYEHNYFCPGHPIIKLRLVFKFQGAKCFGKIRFLKCEFEKKKKKNRERTQAPSQLREVGIVTRRYYQPKLNFALFKKWDIRAITPNLF